MSGSNAQGHENDHIADVSKKDTISRQAAISRIQNLISAWNDWNTDSVKERKGLDAALCVLEDMTSAQPDLQPTCNQLATDCISRQAAIDALIELYEYHYDHTDCIWYRPEARNRCPATCAQYRDGWNDAMNYIFRDGKGYKPYRRDKQYGE